MDGHVGAFPALAASMQRAAMVAEPQEVGSEVGCGARTDGGPCCESCGTSGSDPTRLRAAWADRLVSSRSSLSPFWRAALLSDAFFRSDAGGTAPALDSPIAQGIRNGCRDVALHPSSFDQYERALLIRGPSAPSCNEMSILPRRDITNLLMDWRWLTALSCCVLRWEYPEVGPLLFTDAATMGPVGSVPQQRIMSGGNPEVKISVWFTAVAVFGDREPCRCFCCRFTQEKVVYTFSINGVPRMPKAGDGGEDCLWVVYGPDGVAFNTIGGSRTEHPELEEKYRKQGFYIGTSPYCVGDQAPPPGWPPQYGNGTSVRTAHGLCAVSVFDAPGFFAPYGSNWTFEGELIGRVTSKCPNPDNRSGKISWKLAGTVSTDGKISVDVNETGIKVL